MRAWLIIIFILSFQISLGILTVIPVMDSYYPGQIAVIDVNNSTIMLRNQSANLSMSYVNPNYGMISAASNFSNASADGLSLFEVFTITDTIKAFFSFIADSFTGVARILIDLQFPEVIANGVQAGIWMVFVVAIVQVVRGVSGKTME